MLSSIIQLFGIYYIVIALVVFFATKKLVKFCITHQGKKEVLKNVGQLPIHWFLGHIPVLMPTESAILYSFKAMYKLPKVMQVWFGPFVVYLSCFHPDVVKTILSTDEPKDNFAYRFLQPWIGEGLLISSGKKWRRNRHLLTRAFHFDVLKEYLIVFNSTSKVMLDKWLTSQDKTVCVDMYKDVGLLALDNILQCIMSTHTNCQNSKSNSYLESVKVITRVAMKRLFNPFLQPDFLFYLSPIGKEYRKALKEARGFTERVVNERISKLESSDIDLEKYIASRTGYRVKDKSIASLDFLDILILSKDDQGVGLSYKEICDEVNTFVFEGHDTVSSGLSWAFYNLAIHQEEQELCRKEIQTVIGNKDHLDWEDLAKLTYLTMFIKESLRFYSPVFSVTRKTTKPLNFSRGFGPDQYNTDPSFVPGSTSTHTIPSDFNIGISLLQLHHNPHVWNNPEKFDPNRFSTENIAARSPYAYLPFSTGPRNCIGKYFAMNEMKTTIALALTKFRFFVDETTPKPEMVPLIILRSKNGIHLKLERL